MPAPGAVVVTRPPPGNHPTPSHHAVPPPHPPLAPAVLCCSNPPARSFTYGTETAAIRQRTNSTISCFDSLTNTSLPDVTIWSYLPAKGDWIASPMSSLASAYRRMVGDDVSIYEALAG